MYNTLMHGALLFMCLCLHSASEKRVVERSGSGSDDPTSTVHVSFNLARKRRHPAISPSLAPVANMLPSGTPLRNRIRAHVYGTAVLRTGLRLLCWLVWWELTGTSAVVLLARA
jgi:hypothetical protein